VRHGDPIPSTAPASPTASGPLDRILMLWTAVLAVLVLAGAGPLPPTLVGLLLPYLALVGWHVLSPGGPREAQPQPALAEPADGSRAYPDPQVVSCMSPEAPEEGIGSSHTGDPNPALADPSPSPPVEPREVRVRRRARATPLPEPAPASWVRVGPGRFIRGEEPEPAPDAPHDEPVDDASEAVTSGEEPTHQVVPQEGPREHEAGDSPDDPSGGSTGVGDRDGAATDREVTHRHDEPHFIPDRKEATRDQPEGGETVCRQPTGRVSSSVEPD